MKLSDPHLSGAVLTDTSQLISGGQNVNSKLFSPWSSVKLDAACSLIAGGGGCISAPTLMAVDETWSQTLQSGISSCIAYIWAFQTQNAAPHTPMPLHNQNSQKR